jgi:hypothetical protein
MSDANIKRYSTLFNGVFRREAQLHSREELRQKVDEFFTAPILEIKHRLEQT